MQASLKIIRYDANVFRTTWLGPYFSTICIPVLVLHFRFLLYYPLIPVQFNLKRFADGDFEITVLYFKEKICDVICYSDMHKHFLYSSRAFHHTPVFILALSLMQISKGSRFGMFSIPDIDEVFASQVYTGKPTCEFQIFLSEASKIKKNEIHVAFYICSELLNSKLVIK